MQYRWETFALDREGVLLTRDGQQVDVSRKVLDCITHLIEQRERVVDFSELMRKVWGHENVTNHQLAQVILAARRALGDDGNTQRLIRTVPGRGYRWVGLLSEGTDHAAVFQERTPEPSSAIETVVGSLEHPAESRSPTDTSPAPPPDAVESAARLVDVAAPTRSRGRTQRWLAVSALVVLIAVSLVGLRTRDAQPVATMEKPARAVAVEPLALLEETLLRGDTDAVRDGLATLPMALADSPDGRILEIKLDIARGHLERAAQKLAVQQAQSKAAADPVWQARVLTLLSELNHRANKSATEMLIPAQQALALLESSAQPVPQRFVGEALAAKGIGHVRAGEYEAGVLELTRARDILVNMHDQRLSFRTIAMLAHTWQRMGRLTDALNEFNQLSKLCQRLNDPLCEMDARNSASRLQISLLQWDEALTNSRRSMQLSKEAPKASDRTYALGTHSLVLTNKGRLREAAAMLEESSISIDDGSVAYTTYSLASGNAENALASSAVLFEERDESTNHYLILNSQEGAMLLWMMAAQELTAQGRPMPTPSPAQLAVLQRPKTTPGRIARGRWLIYRGMRPEAEAELRLALEESGKSNQLFYSSLAVEPLVGLLLENNDPEAAQALLSQVRGINPIRMDRDYRVNLLRLRVAIAKGDSSEINDMYRKVSALAGERKLPEIPGSVQTSEHSERTAAK